MNETLRQLYDRKSVRVYTEREISAEEKRLILESALQAPTAGNMTLYTILDITDPQIKACLAESCDHQPFIAEAKMVLIFCADYKRWYDAFCKHVDPVRKPAEGDLFLAQADAFIAAQNTVVAAESLGIGSCYIGDITENFEYHRNLLHLPEYVVPTCMVCFGYPTEQQKSRPKPPRFKVEDIVYENGYDTEKSAKMGEMLRQRQDLSESEYADWLNRFCQRKWNSEFSQEMSRSCREIIQAWCSGNTLE